ncbi:MAG: hypothetical protein QOI01_13 [Mycobacterium sp.]|jgi:hypothetical protein|nr:hypothetical protein [Mycobacterium sp.]MDT7756164.1 hypothetical protein [Mycobacterium sp.]
MLGTTWSRVLWLLLGGLATGAVILGGASSAAADSAIGNNVCRSSVEHGVEVDTCTGNPNGNDGTLPGPAVRVVPQFCFGLGFGGCDD